jgi:hypothetical protein
VCGPEFKTPTSQKKKETQNNELKSCACHFKDTEKSIGIKN